MEKLVTGIGGFFFRSQDPKGLAAWYFKYFGINSEAQGWVWLQDEGPTVFSPFKQDTEYFGRPEQQFMLNLRVNNLEKMLEILQADSIKTDEVQVMENIGKFSWTYDPEGNKIELWEPA